MSPSPSIAPRYERDGFVAPVSLLPADEAVRTWKPSSSATASFTMYPRSTPSSSQPRGIAADARVLEVVEQLIGPDNVLLRGQIVRDVADSTAVVCALAPGQASFHHGWTLHTSMPNDTDERLIGLNVQYIAPSMRQQQALERR